VSTIFTKILNGEIPSYKVAENEHYYAFLDINIIERGHTLVIPKKENDYLFDLSDEEYQGLFLFAKKVALAMDKAIPCQRIGVCVLGLEVRHTHIHLVPLIDKGIIDFTAERKSFPPEEMKEIAASIAAEMA